MPSLVCSQLSFAWLSGEEVLRDLTVTFPPGRTWPRPATRPGDARFRFPSPRVADWLAVVLGRAAPATGGSIAVRVSFSTTVVACGTGEDVFT